MGLFRTPGQKELKRARKEVAENPSPLAYTNLAEKHLQTGDGQAALKVVQEGRNAFPNSDMLERVHGSVKRSLLEEDFRELHARLAQEPTPGTMTRLARLYVETCEEGKALSMCARTIEAFPEHEDAYRIVADIRLHRFFKDCTIKDALIAVANLERVIGLNEIDYKAHQALADFYLKIGMVSKAIECLKTMLVFSPDDDWTHAKMDEAIGLPHAEEGNLETLLLEYVEQRLLSNQAGRVDESAAGESGDPAAVPPAVPEHLVAAIDRLVARDEFRCGLLTDRSGTTLHEASHPGKDPVSIAELCTTVIGQAQRHAVRMEMGHFKKGVINGPFGHVILQASGDVAFGVLLEPQARPEHFENEVESIAESAHAARRTTTPPDPADTDASQEEG